MARIMCMSMPRKKSRVLVINGVEYRWMLSVNKQSTAVVELTKSPGSVLQIDVSWLTDPWIKFPHGNPIHNGSFTNKDICYCVLEAIKQGWDPTRPKPNFNYVYKTQIDHSNAE